MDSEENNVTPYIYPYQNIEEKNFVYSPSIKYSTESSEWITVSNEEGELPEIKVDKLSVMTYNVWFGEDNFENRIEAIGNIIEKNHPDFLCIQEATKPFYLYIQSLPFIQSNYYISHNVFDDGYDVIILSKHNVKFFTLQLPTLMTRKLLMAQAKFNDDRLIISTVHFESMNNEKTRRMQMEKAFSVLNIFKYGFLMGDFNFDPHKDPKEQGNIDQNVSDAWITWKDLKGLESDSKGSTRPPEKRKGNVRYDRIYYKPNDSFKLTRFEILGNEAINQNDDSYMIKTPSDHLAVFTEYTIS